MVTIALPIIGVPLAKRLSEFTGGSQGISARFSARTGVDRARTTTSGSCYIVIAIAGIVFLLTRNLVRGKYGRAFAIVKGNEAVAVVDGHLAVPLQGARVHDRVAHRRRQRLPLHGRRPVHLARDA